MTQTQTHLSILLQRTLRLSVSLCLLWFISCQGTGWWGSPGNREQCDPAGQSPLKQSPLWNKTLGSNAQRVVGCVRISWGTKTSEGLGMLVQLNTAGKLTAYNAETSAFDGPLSVEVPTLAKNRPRRFRFFAFGESFQSQAPQTQLAYCQQTAAKPAYNCLQESVQSCWFALAFRPKPPKGQQETPALTGAPSNAVCQYILHNNTSSEINAETPDASEPSTDQPPQDTPKPPDVTTPETAKEDIADSGCTNGAKRPCQTGLSGKCDQGEEQCQGGQWGKCTPANIEPEKCDGEDNNCDGNVDEGLTGCNAGCRAKCVTTVAGTGSPGDQNGKGKGASFDTPIGIAIIKGGPVLVADSKNNKIRLYRRDGTIETLAGSQQGHQDGQAASAQFNRPSDIAVDNAGNVYVADTENHVIRMITKAGVVSTIAGKPGVAGKLNGPAKTATFNFPTGIAINATGQALYIADRRNHLIRKLDLNIERVTTLAGDGTPGNVDDVGTKAKFDTPAGIHVMPNEHVIVADTENNVIRRIEPGGKVTTLAGITIPGFKDGDATSTAQFNKPSGVALDNKGNLVITDAFNLRIRLYNFTTKQVSTLAGTRNEGNKDGDAEQAQFRRPQGIDVDSQSGAIYIADTDNHTIRILFP